MRKYLVLTAAVLMQCCLGSNYAWSVFVPLLVEQHGLSVTESQVIFGTVSLVFTVVFLLGGRLQDRFGPRPLALVGGTIFCLGYILAGHSDGSFRALWLFIGVFLGAGTGIGYMSPIAASVKWFPKHKGLVTGIAVAGYGMGAVFVAFAAELLFSRGHGVLDVFRILGIAYLVIILPCSLAIVNPAAARQARKHRGLPLKSYIYERRFWGLFCGIFPAISAGLMIIGNLKPIGLSWGLHAHLAATGVGLLAAFNGAGRIVWGLVSDRVGGKNAILASLVLVSLTLFGALTLPKSPVLFLSLAVLIGFNYGGTLVLYASEVARVYGAENMGSVYSTLFVSNGIAGIIAAPLAGKIYDSTGSYAPSLLIFGLACVVSLVVVKLLYSPRAGD